MVKLEKYRRFALGGGESDDAAEKDDPMQGGEGATTGGAEDMPAPPSPEREITKAPTKAEGLAQLEKNGRTGAQQKSKAAPPTRGGSDADVERSEATASEGSSEG